jgi:hypothetical protein
MTKKSLLLNAAIAGILAAGSVGIVTNALAADEGKCTQKNECKGKGACASMDGKSACAGKNSCKNHMFKGTKDACDKATGTWEAAKPAAAPEKKG